MMKRLQLTFFLTLFVGAMMAQIDTLGIIGTGSPSGTWDDGDDHWLTKVEGSAHDWVGDSVMMNTGPFKFRANGTWDTNWGASSFPYGVGTQGGPDIPAVAGLYRIEFNDSSGVYYVENLESNIGIIGTATPFEWNRDINMIPDTSGAANMYFVELDMVQGDTEAKFRENDSWDAPNRNWGNDTSFPSGIAWTESAPNIKVDKPGKYLITFNSETGEYNFDRTASYSSISIIGAAAGDPDWTTDIFLTQESDGNTWSGNVTLVDGDFKFRADTAWTDDWGGGDFPMDTAVYKGDNITATAGDYLVTFNTSTLIYNFQEIREFNSISLIGEGTVNQSWDDGTDVFLDQDADDKSIWTGRMDLLDGGVKFRADTAWEFAWGANEWPSGIGSLAGTSPNIPAVAGEYKVWFNSTSGEYNFTEIIEYDTIGIIGRASPSGDWDNDTYMEKSPDDPNLWTLSGVNLTESTSEDCSGDYGMKFRANSDWAVNWGACDFPEGTGTQDGSNIGVTATDVYSISFNSATGEYAFTVGVATKNLLNPSDIHLYPNPAQEIITIENHTEELQGDLIISIFNINGQEVKRIETNSRNLNTIDVSKLVPGSYLVQIKNDTYTVGKRLIKAE